MKLVAPMPEVTTLDALARPLRDLRISLTDRCNFRCTYCMPRHVFGPDHEFLPRAELLDFDEIVRSARIFAELGVRKLRITGGEPLLRPDLETLIERLAALPGIEDISLTTNASRLTAERARGLHAAGLRRLTVSLDAIDDTTFRRIVDVQTPVARILEAIDHAVDAGLAPVKINAVIKRGLNDDQIEPLAQYFRHSGCVLRFIEFMDVGASNGWKLDAVVPAAEIVQRLQARWPLAPLDPNYAGETANRWRYRDGAGEIGVIASVSEPFCGGCSRARLSAEGKLYTCLFASQGFDLRALLRDGADDEMLRAHLGTLWGARVDRYSELRTAETAATRKVEMSYIGG
nr:GTP 3',8-cyclase MoaA [Algiphilus aromaticivorans]